MAEKPRRVKAGEADMFVQSIRAERDLIAIHYVTHDVMVFSVPKLQKHRIPNWNLKLARQYGTHIASSTGKPRPKTGGRTWLILKADVWVEAATCTELDEVPVYEAARMR